MDIISWCFEHSKVADVYGTDQGKKVCYRAWSSGENCDVALAVVSRANEQPSVTADYKERQARGNDV